MRHARHGVPQRLEHLWLHPWWHIDRSLGRKEVSVYLRFLVHSFPTRRWLMFDPGGAQHKHPMTYGVPQGSVLRQMLWSLFYDDLLRLYLPPGITVVDYCDDVPQYCRWRATSPRSRSP